jgi:sodium-dependent phosphate cotransporter
MTTALMLPIEILSGFLYIVSDKITNAMPFENSEQIAKANFMNAILTPVTDLFIVLNATAVDMLSSGDKNIKDVALRCCSLEVHQTNLTNFTSLNMTNGNFSNELGFLNQTRCARECTYWCMPMLRAFGDGGTGLFWIILSIIVLISSLFGIVKVLSLFIVGPIAKGVTKALNASFPGYFKWVSQVILFLIALFLTIIVQSSNIITATLVPLCGIGIISLQKVYVMTLGSNIGTTVTGILTAFTQPPSSLKKAMQLAFVYTLFNTLGVVYWLPLPFLRFPKKLARKLGQTVFQYRWFLYTYVSTVYVICPLFIFGLALIPHWIGLAIFGLPIVFLFLVYLVILFLRSKFPGILPKFLKEFYWLPKFLRSLKPLDRKIKRLTCCQTKVQDIDPSSPRRLSLANNTIPDVIRRMSVIDTIVRETERMSRRSSIISHESSSSSEEEEEVTEKIDVFNDEEPTKLPINSDLVPTPERKSIFKNKAFDWITEF